MDKEKRYQKILKLLESQTSVSVAELASQLPASAATIRKDLSFLEHRGVLVRSYGGATLASFPSRKYLSVSLPRAQKIANLELKEAIAQEAAKLISDNDTIFIGCGSTFCVFAQHLQHFKNLRVVTTNLNVAYTLASFSHNVYFIGGELMEIDGVYYTGGPKIPYELEKVFVNKAFIGVSGIDLKAGLTIYDLTQLNLYTSICKIAHQIILVSDKTKFGRQSAHRLGPIKGYLHTVVTNKEIDPSYLRAMEQMGIEIVTA